MFWKVLGAIGIGSVLAMAILLMVTDRHVNTVNRVAFAATENGVSDPILEQERRTLQLDLLRKETELQLLEMSSESQLRIQKAEVLQTQRLKNEISFANMLDFLRWAFVAGGGGILFLAAALWLLRLVFSIDNFLYSVVFAPSRIAAIGQARLVERENTPLLTTATTQQQREPSSPRGRERGTGNQERGNRRGNSPATLREGGRRRMNNAVDLPDLELIEEEPPATIEVGDFTLSRIEYLQLSQALRTGRETKSAIARRLAGRYQTNLQKLNAIIEHRQQLGDSD